MLAALIASDEVGRVQGIQLERRLRLAVRYLELGMEDRERQQLEEFLRTVERYRGQGISEAAADAHLGQVEPIVDALGREPLTPTVAYPLECPRNHFSHLTGAPELA